MVKKNNKNNLTKETQNSIHDLFLEDVEMLESALSAMHQAVDAFCDQNFEDAKKYAQITIDIEEDQDHVRDTIIKKLFGHESMVFSRADRMIMANFMDRIVGQAKQVVIDLLVYMPENVDIALRGHLKYISQSIALLGTKTRKLMNTLFEDFDEAIKLITQINSDRHAVRKRKTEFFTVLYALKPPYYDFRFLAELVNNSAEVVNRMEHFGDFVYQLICKYSNF